MLCQLDVLLLLGAKVVVNAAVPCNETPTCEKLLRPGSVCATNGLCTNPFAGGCLRRLLGEGLYPNLRVCNSDDDVGGLSASCSPSRFNYSEIRVAPGNWETSMFMSWIIQILLSERLDVPVTVETGSTEMPKFDFYDIDNSFGYPNQTYNFDAIQEGNRVGDCAKTSSTVSCAHVMPEAWNGQAKAWTEAQKLGYIEPPEGNGMVGKIGWYIPKFLAEQDPSLVSYLGLTKNRAKLASIFNRPTTWLDYCRYVSPTSCRLEDGVARRWPNGDEEEASYFASGDFKGHFRPTDKNNCTHNPSSCTGHIVDAPCTWSTNTESQAYWNDISLESDGPLQPNGGYSYSHMIQIWKAANATKSNVIMWWWRPDITVQAFRGSPAEFQPVLLPEATEECAESRVGSKEERCSSDATVRRGGDALGSCDSEAHSLQKIIAKSLYDDTYGVPVASRSAAYETIKSLRVSDLQMDDMLQAWSRRGVDTYGFDAREAVCSWVAENIQDLDRFFPQGYPRTMEDEGLYRQGYLYAAEALGVFATIIVLFTGAMTYRWRKRRVMGYANRNFLLLILLGFLMVSIAAILYVEEPSLASCASKQWFVTLGYTLGLVPLLVKVAAINKIVQGAAKMKRVTLSPRYLFGVVAAVVSCVLIYLAVWTVVDPPRRGEERVLATEGGNVVEVSHVCSSSSDLWKMLALAWELLLVVCATVLAFQSRKVQQEFNESRSLATVVYVHFIFMLLRGITYLLADAFAPHIRAGITSFLLSLDTLFTLSIYFGPKFKEAAKKKNRKMSPRASCFVVRPRASVRRGFMEEGARSSDPSLSRIPERADHGQIVIPFSTSNQKRRSTVRTSFSSCLQEGEGKLEEEYEHKLKDMREIMEARHADHLEEVQAEAHAELRRLQDRTSAALQRIEDEAVSGEVHDALGVQQAVAKARDDINGERRREMQLVRVEGLFTSLTEDKSESSVLDADVDPESEEVQARSDVPMVEVTASYQAKMAYLSFSAVGEYSAASCAE